MTYKLIGRCAKLRHSIWDTVRVKRRRWSPRPYFTHGRGRISKILLPHRTIKFSTWPRQRTRKLVGAALSLEIFTSGEWFK